jgi:cell division protein FtsI/penicillin-binding protein 2
MRPYILDQVIGQDGQIIRQTQPQVLSENVFDPQYIKVVQDGMRQTVTDGSARSLNALPIPIAGKTGTAQIISKNLSFTHAWFTSYAPADDPQIALTVLIEEGGEGSSYSVPVARDVYKWWAENRWNK